jgi:cholesterol oxidase
VEDTTPEPAGRFDVLVVGSGFGGSVTALRLAEKGYRVGVLESGRRFRPRDFPKTNWRLRRYLWLPRLGMRGIQRISLLRNILVLAGSGVGGGSLVYAGTLVPPLEGFWKGAHWPRGIDWKEEIGPFFDQARRMLGVTATPFESTADLAMRELARRLGAESTYGPTDVGIYFGEPGREVPDPYFGGRGPARTGCVRSGGCMVGCRYGAKNTLDANYLHLAELAGAEIHPDTEVVDVLPMGRVGYQVLAQRPGAWIRKGRRAFVADQVVFSAGVMGTLKLLLSLRRRGRLPRLSPRLGTLVRTNSEAIVGAVARDHRIDYSKGVAIGSSFRADEHTQVEPVRYPRGSNLMGLLGTIMVRGGGKVPRPVRFLGEVVRHPLRFAASLSVRRWSERAVIVLVMQSRDNSLVIRERRGLLGHRLTSTQGEGEPNPNHLPVAERAATETAEIIGGVPSATINEVLLNRPVTAHILGGASIGATAETGVIDPYHRVFGHPGLHVVDGSSLPANPGANPSLTIAALAERAIAHWPRKGEPDPRPPLD